MYKRQGYQQHSLMTVPGEFAGFMVTVSGEYKDEVLGAFLLLTGHDGAAFFAHNSGLGSLSNTSTERTVHH